MLTPQDIHALAALFETAIKQSQQLCELLEQEQQVLLSEDFAGMEELIEQKLRLSQSLDHIEIQRQEIMSKAGQNTDHQFMQHFLQKNRTHPVIQPAYTTWQELMTWLQKSADQNQLNGTLLEKQRQRVQRTLTLLFEQSNASSEYDADGGTVAPEYSRSVGIV